MKDTIISFIKSILLALVLAIIIRTFIFSVTEVSGRSMYPNFDTGDRLIVNRLGVWIRDVEKGEVIEFLSPDVKLNGKRDHFIKRVIGTAGDTVSLNDGKVYLNGEELKEDYIASDVETFPETDQSQWEVKEGEIFVLGDNRYNSDDGRRFGTVPTDTVKGIAVFRFIPFNKFGKIK